MFTTLQDESGIQCATVLLCFPAMDIVILKYKGFKLVFLTYKIYPFPSKIPLKHLFFNNSVNGDTTLFLFHISL